jgi:hypothetical protein
VVKTEKFKYHFLFVSYFMSEVPIANWPNGEDIEWYGKVVQLYVDNKPYLKFPKFRLNIHGDILRRLLDELDIPYKKVMGLYTRNSVPAPTGERYRVVGMGHYDTDSRDRRLITFSGSSMDYGLGIDQKHLDDIVMLQPGWTLRIGS